jgi:hypothetical protein
MKRLMTTLALALPLAVLALQACSDDDAASAFNSACSTADDCPSGWDCPDPNAQGMGAVGNICTPMCEDDAECESLLGRTDVSCTFHICLTDCTRSDQCPSTQPVCRGANPSCADDNLGTLWCATSDFSCD